MPRKPIYLRRLNDPSILRELDRVRLHRLLRPHSAFFAAHEVHLGDDPNGMDVDAIGTVILKPQEDTPYDVVDALTHIDEMATPDGMDRLQRAAHCAGLALSRDEDRTPADLALQLWLEAPNLLRRQHAEHIVMKRRSRDSYLPLEGAPRVRTGDLPAGMRRFEEIVRGWYSDHGRGEGAAIMVFEEEHQVRIVIRHGGPYQRKGCLQDDGPATVQFRPMEFAYAILNFDECELALNCRSKGERDLFRRALGECVFGQPEFFSRDQKFTLEPLRQGRASLRCSDVPGIRRVKLTSLSMDKGGTQRRRDVTSADDVFQAFEDEGDGIPPGASLAAATLEFEFSDSSKPRSVSVRSGNHATYTRDGDCETVERFLRARGFVREDAAHAVVAAA